MNRASSFIGKPVVTQSGEQLETINDVVFDPRTHHVLCFIVKPGGWVGGAKILPWTHDYSITANALIISSQEQIVSAPKVPHIQEVLENTQVVVGKRIIAPDGHSLGILNDVYFDQATGEIHEYEVANDSTITSSKQHAILDPGDVEFALQRGAALSVSAATAELIEQHMHID
jgi:uncharacterized protein YrrD